MNKSNMLIIFLFLIIAPSAFAQGNADDPGYNALIKDKIEGKVLSDEEIQHEFMLASAKCLYSKYARGVNSELAIKQCLVITMYDQEKIEKKSEVSRNCIDAKLSGGSSLSDAMDACLSDTPSRQDINDPMTHPNEEALSR